MKEGDAVRLMPYIERAMDHAEALGLAVDGGKVESLTSAERDLVVIGLMLKKLIAQQITLTKQHETIKTKGDTLAHATEELLQRSTAIVKAAREALEHFEGASLTKDDDDKVLALAKTLRAWDEPL